LFGFALAAVATALAVIGRTRGPGWLHFAAKPLIVPGLLLPVLTLPSGLPANALPWLVAALSLAWVGDVALMFKRGFIPGLVAFLLAHVAYLACFSVELSWRWQQLGYLLVVLPFAWVAMRGVLSHVGRLKPAVALYAVVLTGVAWRLLARVDVLGLTAACAVGILGGAVFMLADSLLVRRRFAGTKVPYWLELGTYAAAQACIVAATL